MSEGLLSEKSRPEFAWSLLLLAFIFVLLLAERWYYLDHFGFVYTDGDQTAFWYQADDIAHGIFREPCLYGQSYNVPIEAWTAAPLMLFHLPAYIALPVAATALGLLPFMALAVFAYRHGQKWIASVILLIPLALPTEYTIVASLPRGFINGLAVCTPAIVCWLFFRSRISFFLAAFFAVLAVTVNPNCAIVLLAACLFAMLTDYRSGKFYLYSALGALAALPAPLLIRLFYRLHPQCDAYHPKASFDFSWQMIRDSIFVSDQPGMALNHDDLNLFFGHFVPVTEHGWVLLFVVFPVLIVLLLLLRRWVSAIAMEAGVAFMVASLGSERVHSAIDNVFYSGSRMFLAVPILMAVGLIWFDSGLEQNGRRWMKRTVHSILIAGLLFLSVGSFWAGRHLLDFPSPLVVEGLLPPVESVEHLQADTRAITSAAQKYHADLVLIGQSFITCMDEAGPVLSRDGFATLSPFFERRTYLIKEERNRRHTTVLVYQPTAFQMFLARRADFAAQLISESPKLLLINIAPPGLSGMTIAGDVGILYRERF